MYNPYFEVNNLHFEVDYISKVKVFVHEAKVNVRYLFVNPYENAIYVTYRAIIGDI